MRSAREEGPQKVPQEAGRHNTGCSVLTCFKKNTPDQGEKSAEIGGGINNDYKIGTDNLFGFVYWNGIGGRGMR